MGTPVSAVSVPTIVRMTRHGQPNQLSDSRMQKFIESGAYDLAVDHPDYGGLAQQLRGEPVIRRAKALDLETCGPKLDPPFDGAQIHTDVYGEGDGSFNLATVELLQLDTSLRLGPALEAVMSRRSKTSMGARRKRWFIERANAGTLPEQQQRLVDQWKKEGRVIFFADTSWLDGDGREYVEFACVDAGRWFDNYYWVDNYVRSHSCVLVSKEKRA